MTRKRSPAKKRTKKGVAFIKKVENLLKEIEGLPLDNYAAHGTEREIVRRLTEAGWKKSEDFDTPEDLAATVVWLGMLLPGKDWPDYGYGILLRTVNTCGTLSGGNGAGAQWITRRFSAKRGETGGHLKMLLQSLRPLASGRRRKNGPTNCCGRNGGSVTTGRCAGGSRSR